MCATPIVECEKTCVCWPDKDRAHRHRQLTRDTRTNPYKLYGGEYTLGLNSRRHSTAAHTRTIYQSCINKSVVAVAVARLYIFLSRAPAVLLAYTAAVCPVEIMVNNYRRSMNMQYVQIYGLLKRRLLRPPPLFAKEKIFKEIYL